MTEHLVTDRTALVGDAAHGLHPIAGQGLNAGMRDIAALVQIITEAQNRGEDYGSLAVLKRYEEWRRFDNTALALATNTFNKLFSNNNVRDSKKGRIKAIIRFLKLYNYCPLNLYNFLIIFKSGTAPRQI